MHATEPLEPRRLLANWITGSGTLIVLGTDGPDAIEFGLSTYGERVTVNGEAFDYRTITRDYTAPGEVRRIHVDAGGGDDRVGPVRGGAWTPQFGVTILGGAGDDRLAAFSSDTFLDGGAGDDRIEASDHATLHGGAGDDVLIGGRGPQVFRDGPGEDFVFGGDGPDTIHAGGRADAPDRYAGGAGHDVVTYADRSHGLGVDLPENDALDADIEVLIGTPHDDVLRATSDAPMHLVGLGGNDRLLGRAGADTLEGGAGDDTLVGGHAAEAADAGDVLHGGPGRDAVEYAMRRQPVTASLDNLRNDGAAGEGDWIFDVENLTGGHGDDLLVGDDAGNVLDGVAGADTLIGLGGNDVLRSSEAWFVQVGRVLDGGAGNDLFEATTPLDSVAGGAGDDVLVSGYRRPAVLDLGGGYGVLFALGDPGDDAGPFDAIVRGDDDWLARFRETGEL